MILISLVLLLSSSVRGFAATSRRGWNRSPLRYDIHQLSNLELKQLGEIPAKHQRFKHLTLAMASKNTKGSTKRTTEKRPSSLSLPLKVGGLYGLLGLMAWNSVRKKLLLPMEATAGIGLLWMGFVLAISFTEAWVKFQAPFLPKHYGLDVGRTVFPVLNAVEVAFCVTLWLLHTTTTRFSSIKAPLSAATIILLSQVVFFTPQLVLLGKHVIRDAFPTPDPKWTSYQEEVYHDISSEVKRKARPSSKMHIVYVLQEFAKIILLGTLVWKCRGL